MSMWPQEDINRPECRNGIGWSEQNLTRVAYWGPVDALPMGFILVMIVLKTVLRSHHEEASCPGGLPQLRADNVLRRIHFSVLC